MSLVHKRKALLSHFLATQADIERTYAELEAVMYGSQQYWNRINIIGKLKSRMYKVQTLLTMCDNQRLLESNERLETVFIKLYNQ